MHEQIILNTFLTFFICLIVIRILGKREVGELSIFDLVVLLLIADVATIGIENGTVELSFLALITMLILQKILAVIVMKFPRTRKFFDDQYSIIVLDGKLNLKEMKKQKYNVNDLINQSRNRGIISLDEISLAILESSGELSIFKKSSVKKVILPIIVSGVVDKRAQKILKITDEHLKLHLEVNSLILDDVYYLASDGINFFHVDVLNEDDNKL